MTVGRRNLRLFWASLVLLFVEVLLIRWVAAEIRIFAYFHNLVLLFAFLGMGLGLAFDRRRARPVLTMAILFGFVLLLFLEVLLKIRVLRGISILLSRGADFPIWYGGDPQVLARMPALLGGTALLILVLLAIVAVFFPLGQILGQLFREHPRPLEAYGINLAGSLLGVWTFALASFMSLPPWVWFLGAGLGCLGLVGRRPKEAAGVLLLTAASVALLYESRSPEKWTIWSPYQKLTVRPAHTVIDGQLVPYGHHVSTNSVGYMQIVDYSPAFVAGHPSLFPEGEVRFDPYNLPYRFAGALDDVLVVGPGAGNDPAGALRNGARRVTAVEIDPGIIRIGRALHPEHPYDDPRIRVVNDDARSFFKSTRERYDLIVFGLLDSHTLSSSYANVRLDNYVYTVESFEEAKRLLRPGGVLVITFEVDGSNDFIGARIYRMLEKAFGHEPIGLPVASNLRGWGGTGFVAGDPEALVRRLSQEPVLRARVVEHRMKSRAWARSDVVLATDDWPYLYLEKPGVPQLHMLVSVVLLLFAAAGLGWVRSRRGRTGADPRAGSVLHFFFLGAGFMLLEVHNISKLALLFGTTWTVNVLVLSAVLVMILLANLVAACAPRLSPRVVHAALFAGLATSFAVPLDRFSTIGSPWKEIVVALFVGFPLLCAGVIFSSSFATTPDRPRALSWNLLGAMVGGMLESLSFLTGIRALLVVSALLYAGSLVCLARARPLDRPLEI